MFFKLATSTPSAADDRRRRRPHSIAAARMAEASWKRKSVRKEDNVLSATALAWSRQLPRRCHPKHTLELYARIANRLASCWSDPGAGRAVFDDLLLDRRGGRRGFPPPVREELLLLRDLHRSLWPLDPIDPSAQA
jgi:hypothetical protein